MYYLAVEGGATKSTALLADERGNVVKEWKGKMLNYHAIGKEEFEKNLAELLDPVLDEAKAYRVRAVFGLAGLNTDEDRTFYKDAIASLLPAGSFCDVVNDAKIALELKCPDAKHRILVISGTGANVYGESGEKYARSIGWDFILGDEGSSYAVGLKALKAAIQSWDGRREKSVLEELALEKVGVNTMEELNAKIYSEINKKETNLKHYIASFSGLVDEGIRRDDKQAMEIREETARDLLSGIRAVIKRLNLENEEFCIGFIGSGWRMPGLLEMVKKAVKSEFPGASFSANEENAGVYGAILLAKKRGAIF